MAIKRPWTQDACEWPLKALINLTACMNQTHSGFICPAPPAAVNEEWMLWQVGQQWDETLLLLVFIPAEKRLRWNSSSGTCGADLLRIQTQIAHLTTAASQHTFQLACQSTNHRQKAQEWLWLQLLQRSSPEIKNLLSFQCESALNSPQNRKNELGVEQEEEINELRYKGIHRWCILRK